MDVKKKNAGVGSLVPQFVKSAVKSAKRILGCEFRSSLSEGEVEGGLVGGA